MNRNAKIFTAICALVSLPLAAEETIHYVVQKNNYLSNILYSLNLKPIYGKQGYLQEVLKLNPGKIKKKGDLVLEGTEIILPVRTIGKQLASSSVQENIPEPIPEIIKEEKKVEKVEAPIPGDSFFQQHSYYRLAPRFVKVGIESDDDVHFGGTKVTNTTESGVGVRGDWRIAIEPQTSLYIFSSIDFINFYKDSNFSLTDTDYRRFSFGVGGEYGLSEVSRVESNLKVNQNYFLQVLSPTNVQMHAISQVELDATYIRNIFTIGKVSSELGVGGMAILPSQDQFKSDLGYGVNVKWTTRFLLKEFQIGYSYKSYKINDINNTSKEILANINFDFGSEK